jgi:hypothetical membrane protein
VNKLKVAGIAGFVAPFFVFVCILVAVASWTQFSWINNALSDLGVKSGLTAVVFNSGLVVGGLLFIVFAVGLFSFIGKRFLGKVGSTVFLIACIMLIAIGVFNENFSPTHYLVSVGLFASMPISLLVLVAAFWVEDKRKLSVFTLTLALFAAAVWLVEFAVHYVPGVAIPEFVSGSAGAAWVLAVSYLMIKQGSKLPS